MDVEVAAAIPRVRRGLTFGAEDSPPPGGKAAVGEGSPRNGFDLFSASKQDEARRSLPRGAARRDEVGSCQSGGGAENDDGPSWENSALTRGLVSFLSVLSRVRSYPFGPFVK